jgi:hypothetical protein
MVEGDVLTTDKPALFHPRAPASSRGRGATTNVLIFCRPLIRGVADEGGGQSGQSGDVGCEEIGWDGEIQPIQSFGRLLYSDDRPVALLQRNILKKEHGEGREGHH